MQGSIWAPCKCTGMVGTAIAQCTDYHVQVLNYFALVMILAFGFLWYHVFKLNPRVARELRFTYFIIFMIIGLVLLTV